MRVAMLLNEYPCRSETFIEDQITGLRELGCDITIFPMLGGPTPEPRWKRPTDALGLALRLGPSKTPWKACNIIRHGEYAGSLRLFFEAVETSRHDPFDVVHAHFGPNGRRGAMLQETGCLRAKRWITSFYGYDVSSYPRIKGRNTYTRLFEQGDLFLPLSNAMRAKLVDLGAPATKTAVHSLGVALDRFQYSQRQSRGDLRILSIARLVEKKGLEFGIKAVASSPGTAYNILGDGPLRGTLQRLIRDLGMQERIRILGWQDRSRVAQEIRNSDLLLAPSVTAADGDEEGTPTVILEAMACGLPVVSTRHAGIPEVVALGESGLLTPERDVPALTRALQDLATNPDLPTAMGKRGREIIAERHDIRKLNRTLLSHYTA